MLGREAEQPTLQPFSSPVEPTHHGADRDLEDLGDLLVGEALDVGEEHGHPELLRQVLERLLHLRVGEPLEQLVLCASTGQSGLEAAEPAVHVQILDVVEIALPRTALLGAIRVDERVREDAEEPGLEVRSLFEAIERAIGLEVGLLHEILGVGRVAGHAQRTRVERRHVLHRLLREPRLVSHGPTLSATSARSSELSSCRAQVLEDGEHTTVLGLGCRQAELREHR